MNHATFWNSGKTAREACYTFLFIHIPGIFFIHGEILEYRIYSNKRRASDCDFLLRFFIVNGCKCVIKIIVNVSAVNSVK